MNKLYLDTNSDSLKITNPKIVSFYQSNLHIDFENVNLLLIDILNNTSNPCPITIDHVQSVILYPDEQKIKELETFMSNMREVIRRLIQSISNKYVIAKSEYIREFKSVSSSENESRELFEHANQTFFENVCSLLSVVFRVRFSNIAEKVKVMLNQFNRILTANTEQIFSKSEPTRNLEEYIQNFESNSSHMIQAIIQLFSDCLTLYETRVKQVADSIKKRDDPTFTVYYKLIYELNDILHQLPALNEDAEISFEHLLSQTFTTASISREDDKSNEYMLMREDKPSIYIETHDIRDRNIGLNDVKQFLKRTVEKNTNSILISHHTGITSKPNFHIEINNNIVVVYLHKLSYSSETLQIATDMIDALSCKLTDFCSLSENKYSIPKDILDNVNREYQQFIVQKETIMTGLKEQQKRLLSQLDDLRFSSLDKYLSTRYSSCKKQGYNCDMCNNFNVGTLKGLAAHKRGCARKLSLSASFCSTDKQLIDDIILLKSVVV